MRKIHIFAAFAAILALSASSLAYSQTKTDTTISGHVTDAKTGEHLPYITILLKGTNIGTQTSASGHYTLRNLPAGRGESYHRRGCGKCNKKPLFPKEAPTLVNVVDNSIFVKTVSPTLADGLVFQPGVRVENDCQSCGFSQARINGLEGHYSQILIDSRPIFSSLAGVYGLEQIPATMIERVEVVRGGGSALFGASAMSKGVPPWRRRS